jgi:hypothetical protein
MMPEEEVSVNVSTPDGQQQEASQWAPAVEVQFLWREILLEEPDTNPWEFACKVHKMHLISARDIWDVADWADRLREDVRYLRLLLQGKQTATGSG